MSHDELVRAQFGRQARTFDAAGFAVRGLAWIVDSLAPDPDDQVLDVAAGAGHLGRALAVRVRHVALLDLTPEMLAQGVRLAGEDGLRNVAFQLGDATALPWLDGQFDLVVCRLALHQVAEPAAVVREMARVARPGGRVAVTDMVVPEDAEVAAETNRLERLRDPSHGRTLTRAEIAGLLTGYGLAVELNETADQELDLADWLARTETPAADQEHVRRRFQSELDGAPPTGLRPFRRADGELGFVHTWATIAGRVSAQSR